MNTVIEKTTTACVTIEFEKVYESLFGSKSYTILSDKGEHLDFVANIMHTGNEKGIEDSITQIIYVDLINFHYDIEGKRNYPTLSRDQIERALSKMFPCFSSVSRKVWGGKGGKGTYYLAKPDLKVISPCQLAFISRGNLFCELAHFH